MGKSYTSEHHHYKDNDLISTYIVTDIDETGHRTTTKRTSKTHFKTKEELRNENRVKIISTSSLIGKLLLCAIILLFGGYFFNGGFNAQVLATEQNTTITNELNGVVYDYDVNYVDYDYTQKLTQLSLLKNVFSLDTSITQVATTSLIEINSAYDLSPLLLNQLIGGSLVIKEYTFIDALSAEEVTINYLSYNLGFKIATWVSPQLQAEYEKYVNISNLRDYINLNYVDNAETLTPKVLSTILRVLTYLNAPIVWLGNFIYDLGVIINFIVSW